MSTFKEARPKKKESQYQLPSPAQAVYQVEKKEDGFSAARLYVDPESVKSQRESALAAVEKQTEQAKQKCEAEYEAQKAALIMRCEHKTSLTETASEQSKQHALFVLEQQHQQRRLEIEQKCQEQALMIEASASDLIMQARTHKVQKEMHDKIAKISFQNPQVSASMFQPPVPLTVPVAADSPLIYGSSHSAAPIPLTPAEKADIRLRYMK